MKQHKKEMDLDAGIGVCERFLSDLNDRSKYRLFRFSMLYLMPVMAIIYFLSVYFADNFLAERPITSRPARSTHINLKLTSQIPSLRLAAKRQVLSSICLKRVTLTDFSDSSADSSMNVTPVMDKVLVTPKSFG